MFSRTITRSTPANRDGTPGRFHTGRRFAYRSSALRSPTLTLVKPSAIGVVTGPFSATLFRWIDSMQLDRQRLAGALERERRRPVTFPVDRDAGGREDAQDRFGDFGADAVAGNERDGVGHVWGVRALGHQVD